jgi:hypothetical protein
MVQHFRYLGALAVTAAIALGTLAATPGTPAAAHTGPTGPFLPQVTQGKAALTVLQPRLAEIAQRNGMPVRKLQETLTGDKTSWVHPSGRLFFSEAALTPAQQAEAPAARWASTVVTAASGAVFKLHSKAGSRRVIYLDFDGHTLTRTGWNTGGKPAVVKVTPYDTDGNPGSYGITEQNVIHEVWKRVSEDYAPFDVDVTTQAPLADAITRSGPTDQQYGTRVLIDPGTWYQSTCRCGGVAFIGVYDYTSQHETYQPALVFTRGVGTGAKNLAEAASHEAGHNLGLNHDGVNTQGYFSGHGAWAPIMGGGYTKAITQWSRGEYTGANNREDDFAVLARHGLVLRTDDHGNTPATATALRLGGAAYGIYASDSDLDVFGIDLAAGTRTFTANANSVGANLDIRLQVLNAAGVVLATVNPAASQKTADTSAGLNATVTLQVGAGRYYLRIDNTGQGSAATSGYSSYGSRGAYSVRVS